MNLCSRSATLRAESSNMQLRTVEATVATENPAVIWDARDGLVEEILLADGAEFARQVPLLADHDRSISSTIGSARNIRVQRGEVVATLHFAAGVPLADSAWELASQRHARDISVGYQVLDAETIPAGQSRVVQGRSFSAPRHRALRVTKRWQIRECSLVPIGADSAATIRSSHERTNPTMPATILSAIPDRELGAMRLADFARVLLKSRGQDAGDLNDADAFRAGVATVEVSDALSLVVSTAVLDGFHDAPDNLVGVYRSIDLPDYLTGQLAAIGTAPTMRPIGRGDAAGQIAFGVASRGGFRLARYGAAFKLDEMDALDAGTIDVYRLALREVGAAMRRMVLDLMWAELLTNPTLADGTSLFHADRGNFGSGGGSALGDTALDTALAAISNQTGLTAEGKPVHYGLAAKYLLVSPDDLGLALRLARAMQTGQGDLVVRADSRLGTTGVTDPRTGSVLAGNATNWLAAAPGSQAPGLVLASLRGRTEPLIGSRPLSQGEWGLSFDVQLSVATAATDGRGLYWSVGQ